MEIGQYGELYTTAAGTAEGTDWASYSYGASIVSNGNGRIKFNRIGTATVTYQAHQHVPDADNSNNNYIDDYLDIPVSSAQLKNANGTYTSTSSTDVGKIYVYVDGTWQLPEWVLPALEVTMPNAFEDGIVNFPIHLDMYKTGSWTVKIEGDGFTIDGSKTTTTVEHKTEMGDNIEFPIRYTAQNIHGSHEGTITITHTNGDSYSTAIEAQEDYMPKFSFQPDPLVISTLTSIGYPTTVKATDGKFKVNTMSENVTSLVDNDLYSPALSWSASTDNPEFTFTFGDGKNALTGSQIVFNPNDGGARSAQISLTATYKDAANNVVSMDAPIVFTVKAEATALLPNNLAFSSEFISAMENLCVNVPIEITFINKENSEDVELRIENNGSPETPVLEIDGNKIVARSIPTINPIIIAEQDEDGTYLSTEISQEVIVGKCSPIITWNWQDLYVGEEFSNPYSTNSDGDVTLTLEGVTKNGVPVTISDVLVYNEIDKTIAILSGLTDEYVATFSFKQAATENHEACTTPFTSVIYNRPNKLDLCVDSERIFKAVNVSSTDVYFNEGQLVFPSGSNWTMHFEGVPDLLRFTPTINTNLLIEESENGSSFGTAYYAEVEANTNYAIELAPATRYVKFSVVNATSLKNLCVEKFNRVRITPEILYMPISDDPINNPTSRTITVTYASAKDLVIQSTTNDITLSQTTLDKTPEGEYRVQTINVYSAATTEYQAGLSIDHEEGGQVDVDIETYRFPQKLPIQLEVGKDASKRFHFVTTAYKNVEWDAEQYAIKMQNKTGEDSNQPFVTFAFYGAPSYISFVPLVATNVSDWVIKEGERLGSMSSVETAPTFEDGVLKQTLKHTTRYVSVTYIGGNTEVVQMTEVNILSDQSAIPEKEELELTEANKYVSELSVGKDLNVTLVNLLNLSVEVDNPRITLSYGDEAPASSFVGLDAEDLAGVFGEDVVGQIPFKVFWDASQATDFATITFTTTIDEQVKSLATVQVSASTTSLGAESALYTGVNLDKYTLAGDFSGIYAVDGADGVARRPVNLANTYDAAGKPLFDYLIIYGETTAAEGEVVDGKVVITTPTTSVGSNAKTPIYVYRRKGGVYEFAMMQENANASDKVMSIVSITDGPEPTRIYITGFCPYASTGYTKEEEGVWYFQGENGAKLDIYLDDCYIYSRNKTPEGRAFNGRYDGQAFSESYVRGSGGVLVFENQDNDKSGSFDVTIHTINNNMLKSNYGCFFELMKGMRAFQVSSPIQVHLAGEAHKANSVTTITFDDKWPIDADDYTSYEHTNGFLSLQKQVNNAPSVDLGNANTVVNFCGGQVELQNAAVVSNNYKTTFAISFRSGLMAGFPMAYGIGTDDVGGTVNFYDGTTSVIPMDVDVIYKDYYLLDVDSEGNAITKGSGDNIKFQTSCLRCPTQTYVYGGSHCMMRACADVTSKGGAPTDGVHPLGKLDYTLDEMMDVVDNDTKLVNVTTFPASGSDLDAYYKRDGSQYPDKKYGLSSVTSDNGKIHVWIPAGMGYEVAPEVDKKINFWKACMTEISAKYMTYGGTVGGTTKILPNEDVKNLLYCQIDKNIHDVIYAGTGTGEDRVFSYQAPVKDPTGQLETPYLLVAPTEVGEEWQNYIETVPVDYDPDAPSGDTGEDYRITDKVYYVVPAQADIWMTFTAPFDVEKLWIVETYDEKALASTPNKEVEDADGNPTTLSRRESVLLEQAKHNADFAAFFAVAMALGRDQTFDQIYNDYIGWGKHVDGHTSGPYTKRGKIELEHYNGKDNFFTANYYLYKNEGDWEYDDENDIFTPQWKAVGDVPEGSTLMEQGETYSILLPYCTGCDVETDVDGKVVLDSDGRPIFTERTYWDYWTGKFLIFESTLRSDSDPHVIKGSNYHDELFDLATGATQERAILTGNTTFAAIDTKYYPDKDEYIWTYNAEVGREDFMNVTYTNVETGVTDYQTIEPTVSFLIANAQSPQGMPAKIITRDGRVIYGDDENNNGNQNGTTGGHIPTVGGGNDLFITSIAGGINVAVAAPQYIRVVTSTGAIIYTGMVQNAVDIALPTSGIYIISGENEVQKILF